MFKLRSPITFTDDGWAWWCNTFHKKHHQKYEVCQGKAGGYVGKVWICGTKCLSCGRQWKDSHDDAWQLELQTPWQCVCGTEDRILMVLTGDRPNDSLRTAYQKHFEFGSVINQQELGGPEDKFFVFKHDCRPCHITIAEQSGFPPYMDEWDLLINYPGFADPMHLEAKKVWKQRRILYTQALAFTERTA